MQHTMTIFKNLFNGFLVGREWVFVELGPGAPKMITTKEKKTNVHDLILADSQLKVHEIAEIVGISKGRIDWA